VLLLAVIAIALRHRQGPAAAPATADEPAPATSTATSTATTTTTATTTAIAQQASAPRDAGPDLPIWERPPLRTSQPFPEEARINEEPSRPIVIPAWMLGHADGGGD
jgi:hypothetical protein